MVRQHSLASSDAPEDPEYSICLRKWFTNDDEETTPGYAYLTANEPLSKLTYCREMTMAQGRLLYEVADRDTDVVIGFLVLQAVLDEYIAHDPAKGISVWRQIAYDERAVLCHTYGTIIRRFPGFRTHPVAAKMMAEEYCRQTSEMITAHGTEMLAVRYVRDHFTSYQFRCSIFGPVETREYVKLRMRSILRQLLGEGLSGDEQLAFEMRWELHETRSPDEEDDHDASESADRRRRSRVIDVYS
nr:hypothetical protein CFP56_66832 [Quercus suber]